MTHSKFVVIRITDGVAQHDNNEAYAELLRVFDQLDRQGMVNVLACAYGERIRMS